MRIRVLAIGAMFFAVCATGQSYAAVVSASFEGDFILAGNPTFDSIFTGTSISGSFSYETRSTGSASLGVYFDALTSFSATVTDVPEGPSDTLEYSAPAGTLTIVNGSASGSDEFRLNMKSSDGLTGSMLPLGQGEIIAINFLLEDTDAIAFANANTPETLSLSDFENATIDLSNPSGNAIFQLTSLEGAIVPLPGAIWLFGSGLFGFLLAGPTTSTLTGAQRKFKT